MRLKDQFDDLVKCYLPKDGILPPPVKELTKVKPEDKGYNLEEGKQPNKKKPRQSNEALVVVRINSTIIVFHTYCYPGLSPIKFSLIDAPTKRGRDLQIKTNMLQSMTLCNSVVIDECTVGLCL